jgi:DNA gyrase inhibitor GyrI
LKVATLVYSLPGGSAIEEACQRLANWLSDQPMRYSPCRFGFDVEVTPDQRQAGLRGFEAWWTIPEDLMPDSGIEMQQFPGGLYAVLTIDLPFRQDLLRAPAGWKLLHEWVIRSGRYCTGSHQWLEEWIPCQEGGRLKLYHPVMEMAVSSK